MSEWKYTLRSLVEYGYGMDMDMDIGVHSLSPVPAHFPDLFHGLHHTYLVVHPHDGYQCGLISNSGPQLLQIHQSIALHRQVGHLVYGA